MKLPFYLQGITSGTRYEAAKIRYRGAEGELLQVTHVPDFAAVSKKDLVKRLASVHDYDRSGVWRFRELVLPIPSEHIVTKPEGNTNLYSVGSSCGSGYRHIGEYADVKTLYLKHEGENPTGSFKDRGMTTGISMARCLGATAVACASTGNTSASLASYAAQAGMKCFVFIPEGKISYSKLSQALAYGAVTIQIAGDFDAAMQLVEEVCTAMNVYLLNSINPFRIEGQKTICFEMLQQLGWNVPDWIVLPGGNLGNTAALGKGLEELLRWGFITRLPRIATIQAEGANPFFRSFISGFGQFEPVKAETIATAIRIGNPVSYQKARHAIEMTRGVVASVSDEELMNAKAVIDRSGIGCEPASAATLAGIRKLRREGVIGRDDTVAGILTGHVLKDPAAIADYHAGVIPGVFAQYQNTIHRAKPALAAVERLIARHIENKV